MTNLNSISVVTILMKDLLDGDVDDRLVRLATNQHDFLARSRVFFTFRRTLPLRRDAVVYFVILRTSRVRSC